MALNLAIKTPLSTPLHRDSLRAGFEIIHREAVALAVQGHLVAGVLARHADASHGKHATTDWIFRALGRDSQARNKLFHNHG